MEGLHSLAGAPESIVLNGKTYFLSLECGLGSAYAECEAWVIRHRPNVIEQAAEACKNLPEAMHGKVIDAAIKATLYAARGAHMDEVLSFLQTLDGAALFFWIAVRSKQVEVDSQEKAKVILLQAGTEMLEETLLAIGRVSGLSTLGNLSGRAGQQAKKKKDQPKKSG